MYMNNKIKKFYDMATEYCSYIKKTKITKELVDDLLIKITNLYVSALELPNTSYDKEKIDYSTIKISVQVDEDINKYFE